jgi:hypothetical protein
VFTAGGGWFAGQALFGARTGGGELAGEHGASWYHAAMMAAMVWMAVAMSALTTPATVPAGSGAAGQTGAMPGMAAAAGPGPAAMAMGAPAWWVSAGCLLLCAAFFGAALYFATTLWLRQGRGAGTGALMAAGLAVTFLRMAGT